MGTIATSWFLILHQSSSSIVWYAVSQFWAPKAIHFTSLYSHLSSTFSIFFMPGTLPRSTTPGSASALHHTGPGPTIAERASRRLRSGVRLLLGHCGGEGGELCQALLQRSQVGKPRGSAWSLGESMGLKYVDNYWNIYIDRDYRDFQQNIEIVGFLLLEKNAFPIIEQWSNMKALRFIAALKQLGLKTIKYVHRMMRDMRRVLETMINHNVNGFLSEMVDLTIKNCG